MFLGQVEKSGETIGRWRFWRTLFSVLEKGFLFDSGLYCSDSRYLIDCSEAKNCGVEGAERENCCTLAQRDDRGRGEAALLSRTVTPGRRAIPCH